MSNAEGGTNPAQGQHDHLRPVPLADKGSSSPPPRDVGGHRRQKVCHHEEGIRHPEQGSWDRDDDVGNGRHRPGIDAGSPDADSQEKVKVRFNMVLSQNCSEVRMEQHQVQHGLPRRSCQFCAKWFCDVNKLKRHVAEVHEGRRNFICKECGKSYARSEKLRAHERVHLPDQGRKLFLCHLCGRSFGRQEHVRRHLKVCDGGGGVRKPRSGRALAKPFEKELARVASDYGLDRMQRDAGSGLFHCQSCEHSCKERRSMVEHFTRAHCPENRSLPHQCDQCGRRFKVIKDLEKHKKRPHMGAFRLQVERCDLCQRLFSTKPALTRHLRLMHPLQPDAKSQSHVSRGPDIVALALNLTLSASDQPADSLQMVNRAAEDLPSDTWATSAYEQLGRGTQPETCSNQVDCSLPGSMEAVPEASGRRKKAALGLSEQEKEILVQEMQNSHLGVLCHICGKILKNRNALRVHIANTRLPGHGLALQLLLRGQQQHPDGGGVRAPAEEAPPRSCLTRTEARRSSLHRSIPSGIQQAPCPECSADCLQLAHLKADLHGHRTNSRHSARMESSRTDTSSDPRIAARRSHVCRECGAGFLKADHLRRHINAIHLKIKNVQCQFCEKRFGDKYKAKIHERLHTGEAPYLCCICAKTFRRKEALDLHSVVHRKDQPKEFKCVTCGAKFLSQQYLNRHIARHFAAKEHHCGSCPMTFADRRGLSVHKTRLHHDPQPRPFAFGQPGSPSFRTVRQGLAMLDKVHLDRASGNCSPQRDLAESRGHHPLRSLDPPAAIVLGHQGLLWPVAATEALS